MRIPFVTAHSGCMDTKMNSMEYLEKATKSGVDIIEIDVSVTKNKVPILYHDEYAHIKGEKKRIKDLTYAQLKQNEDNLLLLEEAIDYVKHKEVLLNIDIKDCLEYEVIADTIVKKRMSERVFLTGCGGETVRKIKKLNPLIQVLLNIEKENTEDFRKLCNIAVESFCCGVNLDYRRCTKEFVDFAHKRGLMVFVWTVDEVEAMNEIIKMGVESITTNRIRELKEILARVWKE
ncbi:Glycerophosphoryl diester phosphodiesterase [Thermoanaerobacter sp. YS13]|uniref:glycerophosphodiester phosphodiesterase n=1 Tax=Thermoanaerobacter sp. YS13 TaxID=1511746 RepID=UPI0005732CB2|nr:glycerophosphodiester phosphodiesterase [Thermoanaerobacter sp. YS13]KHO61670.1 Glycerophosphoryl diester phosphodiesterase [Thermoanaerobacter sp. YS13]